MRFPTGGGRGTGSAAFRSGTASIGLTIPAAPGLAGLQIAAACAVLNPAAPLSIEQISAALPITLLYQSVGADLCVRPSRR